MAVADQPAMLLDIGETPLLSSSCKYTRKDKTGAWVDSFNIGRKGVLFLTNHYRLVFLASSGFFKKTYEKHHHVPIDDNIVNIQVPFSRLIIDTKWLTHSYDGIFNGQEWSRMIVEMLRRRRKVGQEEREKEIAFLDEAATIMSTQPRTTFDEVRGIYLRHFGTSIEDSKISEFIRRQLVGRWISGRAVEGFVDEEKKEFVHEAAFRKETVQYVIASRFDFAEGGGVNIRCPHCGGSQPASKSKQVTCEYCGKEYIIPKKILDMI